MKKPLVIIILGVQGSGKGTQAEFLKKKFNLKLIGSGDMLRARKKIKDFTGIKIKNTIDKGCRVPTPVIFKMWMDELEKFKKNPKGFNGLIFDGSPRTLQEAEMMEQAFSWYELDKNKKVFFITLSEKEAILRLTKRRNCKKCGRIMPFVGEYRKMKRCDKCGGELFTREDDTVKGVKKRLAWFKTDVMPAINFYKKKGGLVKINGEQSIEAVYKNILKALK